MTFESCIKWYCMEPHCQIFPSICAVKDHVRFYCAVLQQLDAWFVLLLNSVSITQRNITQNWHHFPTTRAWHCLMHACCSKHMHKKSVSGWGFNPMFADVHCPLVMQNFGLKHLIPHCLCNICHIYMLHTLCITLILSTC